MRDNPRNETRELHMHRPMGEFDAQVHIHDIAHEDIHPLFRELRQLLDSYDAERPRLAIAELHIYDLARWSRYYGVESRRAPPPLQLRPAEHALERRQRGKLVAGIEAAVPPGAWPNYVLGNHDEPRVATRVGPEQARVAMMLLLDLARHADAV